MLCQNCQMREATVHLHKVINGQVEEKFLCEECAQKAQELTINFHPGMMVADFLQALFGGSPAKAKIQPQVSSPNTAEEESCPRCGMTLSQISQTGKLGCSACYEKFADQLEPLFRQIHGGGQHLGKIPLRRGAAFRERAELRDLKNQLQNHVAHEEFEEAAVIRDQIRQLEKKLEEQQKEG